MNHTYCLVLGLFFLHASILPAQIYTVNTLFDQDDGLCNAAHCSLREAVRAADSDNRPSIIQFNLPGDGPFLFRLDAPLPDLLEPGTTLNGATQPGFQPGDIVLDGANLPAGQAAGLTIRADETAVYGLFVRRFPGAGLQILGARQVRIGGTAPGQRNIISGNGASGIFLSAPDLSEDLDVRIENNLIGLTPDGSAPLGNALDGIEMRDLAGVQIGGLAENAGNVISGNTVMGIRATRSAGLAIVGNRIGVDAPGRSARPNGVNGVNLTDCTRAQIGAPGAANVISGNREDGVLIARNDIGLTTEDIRIQANRIGTTASGDQPLGNAGAGILCYQIDGGLLIGGDGPDEGNVLADNNRGIWLSNSANLQVAGNVIGTDPGGTADMGNHIAGIALLNVQNMRIGGEAGAANTIAYNLEGVWVGPNSRACRISRNRFFCNALSGINVTEGSNHDVGAPAFLCAYADEITGIAPPMAEVEVFRMDETCAGQACQGERYIGTARANADGSWRLPGAYELGAVYTATATDAGNNTSIFLECVPARIRPQAMADNSGPYCKNAPVQLFGSSNLAGASFSWTGPGGFVSSRQNPDHATLAGPYVLTVVQGGCPSAPDTTIVEFVERITVEIGGEPESWLCPGQSITVNGAVYDEGRPTGMEVVPGRNGACDTVYHIDLHFYAPAVGRIDTTLCAGTNLLVGRTVFDEVNPAGTVVLAGAGNQGCDSVVAVSLSFYGPAVNRIDTTLCPGSRFVFNGEVYDENRPVGRVVIPGGSAAGCDSLVDIQVQFLAGVTINVDTTLCRGQSLTIRGRLYDEARPEGAETLPGRGGACDTTLFVQVRFVDEIVTEIRRSLCPGESLLVNGRRYGAGRLSGVERISGGSVMGCDSVIAVELELAEPPVLRLVETLCEGEFLEINGVRYDERHPAGRDTIFGGAVNGCDSLIEVALTFAYLEAEILSEKAGCLPGDRGALVIGRLSGGTPPYQYSLPGGEARPVASLPLRIGELDPDGYEIIISDANGCSIQQPVVIDRATPIEVDAGPDLRLAFGDSLRIEARTSSSPQQIQWTPGEGLSCTACLSPVARPERTTTYTLSVRNADGCGDTDEVRIEVFEPAGFYLPNAFSPNGDGANEILIPFADPAKVSQVMRFQIYDRWGDLLFERRDFSPNDENAGWDGQTARGERAPAGAYVYLLEIRMRDGEIRWANGMVYLVK